LNANDTLRWETAEEAPTYISSEETISAARRGLEVALPPRALVSDAIIVGCFGDLGINALQRSISIPVLTLWDAYVLAARETLDRIGIVTTSAFWVDRIQQDAERLGLGSRTVVRGIDVAASSTPRQLTLSVRRAVDYMARNDGVDVLVLGGALFAVPDPGLDAFGLPIMDLLAAAARFCRSGRPDLAAL